jgi:hypothetical protein
MNDFQRNLLDIEILSNLRFGSLEIRTTSVTRVTNNFSSASDLSLIFFESFEYYFELLSSILISNCLFQFFLSVSVALMNPSKRQQGLLSSFFLGID